MPTLDFTPPSITVRTTVGASLSFSVTTKNADGSLFPLDGYTITAPFTPREVTPPTLPTPPPVDAFTVELTDTATITLTLTSEQTAQLAAGYLQSPIVWSWATWLESAAGRLAMLRGELMLTTA
jgi:hypothetical protein